MPGGGIVPSGCKTTCRYWPKKLHGLLDDTLVIWGGHFCRTRWGRDHTRLTCRFQGRDFRLTDLHGKVVNGIMV